MNASDLLLDQWTQQVKEVFPKLHYYQQETLAFVVRRDHPIRKRGDAESIRSSMGIHRE